MICTGELMPAPDPTEHEKALNVCERMLAFDMDRAHRSNVLRKIGECCIEILRERNDREICERAISAFEEALSFYSAESHPGSRGRVLRGLGIACIARADHSDRLHYLSKAVSHLEEALHFYSSASDPLDHAEIQNELGRAYRRLAELDCGRDNAKRAIEACRAAQRIYSPKDDPIHYAKATANLAGAVLTLAQSAKDSAERAGGYKSAISLYQEAISFYPSSRYPNHYASMMNNLAIAYLALSEATDRKENCERAQESCRIALLYQSIEEQPLGYAASNNNLGNIYLALAEELIQSEVDGVAEGTGDASHRSRFRFALGDQRLFPGRRGSIRHTSIHPDSSPSRIQTRAADLLARNRAFLIRGWKQCFLA